jgi:hypothetical protein
MQLWNYSDHMWLGILLNPKWGAPPTSWLDTIFYADITRELGIIRNDLVELRYVGVVEPMLKGDRPVAKIEKGLVTGLTCDARQVWLEIHIKNCQDKESSFYRRLADAIAYGARACSRDTNMGVLHRVEMDTPISEGKWLRVAKEKLSMGVDTWREVSLTKNLDELDARQRIRAEFLEFSEHPYREKFAHKQEIVQDMLTYKAKHPSKPTY